MLPAFRIETFLHPYYSSSLDKLILLYKSLSRINYLNESIGRLIDSLLHRLPAGCMNSLLHGCIASLIHASLIHIIVGRSFDSLLPSWIHRCIAQVVLSLHTCPIDSLLHLVFRLLLHYVIDSLLHLLFQTFIRMNARNLSGVCLALLCRPVWCALSAPFRREK